MLRQPDPAFLVLYFSRTPSFQNKFVALRRIKPDKATPANFRGFIGGHEMQIREMSYQEVAELIGAGSLGHLACARNGEPYVTLLFFAKDGDSLFALSSVGQKIHWMRENPHVCVEFARVSNSQDWSTVLVNGVYEELSDTPEGRDLRECAYQLLQRRPVWWEPAYVKTTLRSGERPLEAVYFRIRIRTITGHRSVTNALPTPRLGVWAALRSLWAIDPS